MAVKGLGASGRRAIKRDSIAADPGEVGVHTAARPALSRRQLIVGVARIWALSAAMLVAALALYLVAGQDVPALDAPVHLPWWVLIALFLVTELNVIKIRYRAQAQSFPLNEIPLVLGFFFSTPPEVLIGLLVGSAIAGRVRRQSPLQLAFNTCHFFLAGVIATMAFAHVVVEDPLGPRGWSGAILATMLVTVVGHAAITAATVLSGSQPQVERLSRVLSLGLVSGITATMVGLIAVGMLWRDQRAAVLLLVPALMAFMAYRGYVEERNKSETFELIYESTRMLHRSPEVDSALVGLLAEARQIFHAERAEITLFPLDGSDQALRTSLGVGGEVEMMEPVALSAQERAWTESLTPDTAQLYPGSGGLVPSLMERGIAEAMALVVAHNDRVVGSIVVANPVESRHFDRPELALFESLAGSVGVVIESGGLEQSLKQLRDLEARLRHQADHDPLTELANRARFAERVERALEWAGDDRSRLAVLFVDLDHFKVINDSRGHTVGDRLLVAVGERIADVVGSHDSVARLGGDEFAVLLADHDRDAAVDAAAALLGSIRRPFHVDGEQLQIRASVGVAPGDSAGTADELLRNADVAMYTAKDAGRDRFEVFSEYMHLALIERHELISDLQRAIEREEFVLHFQPIVELATGRIVALESLVRWHHPARGEVGPNAFIPVAEETGLILEIGRLVLAKACAQAREWQEQFPDHRDLSIGVNISARQLHQPQFVDDTRRAIVESGVSPSTVILEITESVLMQDMESSVEKLVELKRLGLRLAMDDFGTGYSSLSFLAQLPIDLLKVAKPFVEGLGRGEPREQAFAHAIVSLGRAVGMALIAEGVERENQLSELAKLGCDMGQGHWFAPAGDARAIGALLAAGPVVRASGTVQSPA